MNEPKKKIEQALHQFARGNLADNAKHLLNVLGYESQRTMNLDPNTADSFLSAFNLQDNQGFNPERALIAKWESIDVLFQLTEDEIGNNPNLEIDFGGGKIDDTRMESYLFFAIKLSGNHYTRTQLSQIAREMNKPFDMPVMVLFQHGDTLTFAVIDRRLNKLDESKDVLLKATLIKDINFGDPHRAHIDILFDLSITELHRVHEFSNFPEFHEAWKKTLDTEALNKQFYQRLFNWFEWAISEARFPENEKRTVKPEEHVIRLITRLLFVWFIKEKGLIADELFNETQVARLLKDFKPDSGDSYYRAVLQNLFFATLNTEIEKRRFSKGTGNDHRNFSLYRYKVQMSHPDRLVALFGRTPFINGGLFDCLDNFKGANKGGYRIDCFSDEHYDKLSIPNKLFFHDERGLISLLKHYKFTVEENTPIEQEVALDPELLGKVFENLLAAYNPETGETVRKQTGSYYTPRAIVDYMVEEALVAVLTQRVAPADGDTELWEEELRYLFDYAQVCDDASAWFDDDETDRIVGAISELKILDPAVGSGAFPMSVLHKLTLALRRLDPDNRRWKQLQEKHAGQRASGVFSTQDDKTRRGKLLEIDETFKRYRDSNFGRKLYLIQYAIYGVDIQPVACQIAKLRFFISLAIEQEPDRDASNFGIKPLPNLETRFVAANTLIGLELSETRLLLQEDSVQQLIKEIEGIREKHFLTNNRQRKLDLEEQEDELRERLKQELEIQREKWVEIQQREIERKVDKLPKPEQREQLREVEQEKYEERKEEFNSGFKDARKIAGWKPYDQNASADWFDSEWMFGVTDGFAVVIGNPPYVRHEKIKELKPTLKDRYDCYTGTADLYIYFYERGFQLLRDNGILAYISSNKYFRSAYGKKLRNFLARQSTLSQLIDFGDAPVFTSIAYPSIITASKAHAQDNHIRALNWVPGPSIDEFGTVFRMKGFAVPQNALTVDGWQLTSPDALNLLEKLRNAGKSLGEYVKGRFYRGITTGLNAAFVVDRATRDKLIAEHSSSTQVLKPFLRGRDVRRWQIENLELYLCYVEWGLPIMEYPAIFAHLKQFEERLKARPEVKQGRVPWYALSRYASDYWQEFEKFKIVYPDIAVSPQFAYDERGTYGGNTMYILATKEMWLLGLLNSKAVFWFYTKISTQIRGGFVRYIAQYVSQIPIPNIETTQKTSMGKLVDEILAAKHAEPDADVSVLEKEIDQIVYSLYDLTCDEIAIVEENTV